jgi:hypothetical protein
MDLLQKSKNKTKDLVNRIKGNLAAAAPSPNGTGTLGRFVFMDFCKPAKFYLIFALLTLMYYASTNQAFIWIILKGLLFIIWGFLLNKLCVMEYKAISWLMAIIPQCLFIFVTMSVSPAIPMGPKPVQAMD